MERARGDLGEVRDLSPLRPRDDAGDACMVGASPPPEGPTRPRGVVPVALVRVFLELSMGPNSHFPPVLGVGTWGDWELYWNLKKKENKDTIGMGRKKGGGMGSEKCSDGHGNAVGVPVRVPCR
jgi:hypothetical protein